MQESAGVERGGVGTDSGVRGGLTILLVAYRRTTASGEGLDRHVAGI